MRICRWIAGLFLLCVGGAVPGEVYRWVDSEGAVHFGDHPGGAAGAARIELHPGPPPASAGEVEREDSRARLLRYYDEKRAEEREAAAQARREREVRALRCGEARRLLERYSSFGRIFEVGEDGQRHYLSGDERDQLIAKLETEVGRWCED